MRPRHVVALAVSLPLLAIAWAFLAPTSLGGGTSYLVTKGASMAPRVSSGDLVVLRESDHYAIGDVAGYRMDADGATVVHRIVDRVGTRFVLRGDNNDWFDPERPSRDQVIGKEALHLPGAGTWLHRLSSPWLLGPLLALVLLAGDVKRRKSRRSMTMAHHVGPRRRSPLVGRVEAALGGRSDRLLLVSAVTGALGVVLGLTVWSTHEVAASSPAAEESIRYSYEAQVNRSPAYDTTTVSSPEPVFRAVAESVLVTSGYLGRPGELTMNAEVSTESGWHTTLELAPPVTVDGVAYDATAPLDLDAIQERATAAAQAIGTTWSSIAVDVVTTVRHADGTTFTHELPLELTPLQLVPVAGAAFSSDPGAQPAAVDLAGAPSVEVFGLAVPPNAAWALTGALCLFSLAGLALGWRVHRARSGTTERDRIRLSHAELLLDVQPMTPPHGRPVVDVLDFATLAKVAERYGLLVNRWSRSGVDTYVVQDVATTYRYRTGDGAPAEQEPVEAARAE